jgi:hypothetical protein
MESGLNDPNLPKMSIQSSSIEKSFIWEFNPGKSGKDEEKYRQKRSTTKDYLGLTLIVQ